MDSNLWKLFSNHAENWSLAFFFFFHLKFTNGDMSTYKITLIFNDKKYLVLWNSLELNYYHPMKIKPLKILLEQPIFPERLSSRTQGYPSTTMYIESWRLGIDSIELNCPGISKKRKLTSRLINIQHTLREHILIQKKRTSIT